MDLVFGCHAFFALLWVLTAYVQMVVMRKPKWRAWHAAFGRLAALSFACHVVAALAIVAYDTPRNTRLNKAKLIEVTLSSTVCFARSIWHATHGRQAAHRQWMVACFVLSIEGAGTIRSVTLLTETINSLLSYSAQQRLEYSTTACAYLTQTTEWGAPCAQQYFVRMLLVRVMSGFHLWCYARWERSSTVVKRS